MKSKKLLGVVLSIIMVGTLFAGCTNKSGDSSNGEKVNIKYATYSAGPDHIQDLEKMIAEFEKQNPDINVEYEVMGFDNYFTKLQTQASSNTLPDIFEINYENFITYAENGVLLELDDLQKKDSTFKPEDLSGEAFKYFNYKDKLFGLTEKFSDVVLYYNKDLFDEAGVSYPTEDWTWDEELEASKKLTKDNTFGSYSPIQFTELYKTVAQNGGSLFDKDGNPTINSKENIEAVQWMMDKMHKYNIQPTPKQMSGKTPEEMFKNGELAMIRTGSWMFGTFNDASFDWDIALEPGNTNKVHHVFADGIVASKNTKNPESTWKFIKFMSLDPEATKIRLESNWDLPAASNEDIKKTFLENKKPASREVIFKALDTGIMPPVVKKNSQVQDIVNKELNQAVIEAKTVEQALNDAQNQVEKIIK
ncbi:extracellular solute-binding protein [uncultured Clostridium sp.]|uniref:extracellular solute-binding protein n=1 Tax=uncultured Clostridium sp. TaxID=59620 RepID=UPI0028E39607|nr:extracellular solute-binding protein [uncultured Clostridium sp.]